MMKKMISLLLSLVMLLSLLAACQTSGEEPAPAPDQPSASDLPSEQPSESAPAKAELSCMQVLVSVWEALGPLFGGGREFLYGDSPTGNGAIEQLAAYLQESYGLDEGEWEDACVAYEAGGIMEMAVLRFADEDAAAHGYDCLSSYLSRREADFEDFADIFKQVANAALVSQGQYVGMFIVNNSTLAEKTFTGIVETGKLPEVELKLDPTGDVNKMLDFLLEECEARGMDIPDIERVDSSDPDKLSPIIEDVYGLAGFDWSEAAIVQGADGSVFELAVLRMADGQRPWDIVLALADYLDAKEEVYARFPAQAGLLSQAVAGSPLGSGLIVIAVCEDAENLLWAAARRVGVMGCSFKPRYEKEPESDVAHDPNYPDRVLFTPPNEEDMSIYDTSAIRAAWENSDPTGLSENDQAVYDAAEEILGEILRDGMTELEKETAIFTWLVNSVDYDWTHQDILAETPRTSYQPYGGLVDQAAICLGYATSFQLLCDLSGIECITVVGACFNSTGDHAWNMVRLDGKWYCVDVTWDANGREQLGESYEWKYFNVTSDEMAKNHQWDYANTPEATT